MTQQNETNLTDIHENWRAHANCQGKTHLMFPTEYKDITYIKQARQICNNCPVKTQCLNHALEYPAADMHGVWAGLTSRQLLQEQRKRGITAIRPSIAQMYPR